MDADEWTQLELPLLELGSTYDVLGALVDCGAITLPAATYPECPGPDCGCPVS